MPNITKAVILAGGKGTRLAPALGEKTPKALAEVGGIPLLEHQLKFLQRNGVKEVWLLLGHLGDEIQKFLEEKEWGMVLHYIQEEQPQGTGGALRQLENEIGEDFLVLSGDVMLEMHLQRFIDWHFRKAATATLVAHPSDHPFDSDLVEADKEGRVTALLRRPHEERNWFHNLSIASVYILSPKIFQYIPKRADLVDFEKDVLPVLLESGERVYAYNTPEYIKDMGIPERLEQVCKDYESGKIEKMSLRNERRAVFFDRDGVLIEQVDQLSRPEDLKVYDFAVDAVKKINETDFMAIVVSNQPMVAKGFMTEGDVDEIHKKLETELGKKGAKVDAIYYCPHHPEKGFEGERSELKIECECRKPEPGLLLQARKDFNLNLSKSYMVGDQTADMVAGERAGCKTVLLNTGYAGQDGKYEVSPNSTASNVLAAIENIMRTEQTI